MSSERVPSLDTTPTATGCPPAASESQAAAPAVVAPAAEPRTASLDTVVRRKGGRGPGSLNYSFQEQCALLKNISDVKPRGDPDWERVRVLMAAWSSRHNRPQRKLDSLRKKFFKWCNTRVPTGDPHCPFVIREAKKLFRQIEGRVCAGSLGLDDELARRYIGDDPVGGDSSDDEPEPS